MSAPRWALALLRRVAAPTEREDVVGDLEEAHARRLRGHRAGIATLLTSMEALDMTRALLLERIRRRAGHDSRLQIGGISWLDIKLGLRMLVKYPGLTLVGGLGMAVAIAIGAAYSAVLQALIDPTVPLPEGNRIVALQNWDARVSNKELRSLHDFVAWREELESVQDVGAYLSVTRNLFAADGTAEPLMMAEMSAAGFRVARVQPLLGRYLLEEDERAGALPVVVIGYDAWQGRFAGDRSIVGRQLRISSRSYTVIGVMPDGFAFPINHQFWIPFRADPNQYERGAGPYLNVFARLAPGVTHEEAQAELNIVGRRAAAAYPQTHQHLRAQVQPYTYAFSDMDDPGNLLAMRAIQLLVTLLLVVVGVNVAALIYARTAARRAEIVVRMALGAGRRRVVTQLFAEALVLAAVSAAIGLGIAAFALHQTNVFTAQETTGGQRPFWMDFRLSYGSIGYGLALAVLGAVITGVVPALKVTGQRLQGSLQRLSSGGSALLLGRTWTFLIIAQVAFAVALLPTSGYVATEFIRFGSADPGYPADEFVTAYLHLERDAEGRELQDVDFAARYAQRTAEVMRRLRSEPAIAAVTLARSIPGGEPKEWIEFERSGPNRTTGAKEVRVARVDVGFLEAFEVPILSGRGFHSADADTSASAVIVSQSFAREHLGGGNVLGRRLRFVDRNGELDTNSEARWYEVVGVVPDFPNALEPDDEPAKVYQPLPPEQEYPVRLTVRAWGAATGSAVARLRQVAAAVDPALQVRDIVTIQADYNQDQSVARMVGLGVGMVTLSVLLLSAAGIYAMTSFSVARRRREIGIRAALGANPRSILASIFGRSALQVAVGIAVGLSAAALFDRLTDSGFLDDRLIVLLPIVSAIMLIVVLLASIGPARRGLRIQPTEALKQE